MYVARRVQLKHDSVGFFRRLRKRGDHFQTVMLVTVNLVAGADPKFCPAQITRFLTPIFDRFRPSFRNS